MGGFLDTSGVRHTAIGCISHDFYLKLTLIGIAMTLMQKLKNRVLSNSSLSETAMMAKGRSFAMWSLILWAGAITAGRLLAYTYSTLTA